MKDDCKTVVSAELQIAAREGARQCLRELGLDDKHARDDLHDLREWFQSFRAIKKTVATTTAKVITVAFWTIVVAGVVFWLKGQIKL